MNVAYDTDIDAYMRSGVHLWRSVIARAVTEAEGRECVTTNRRETKESIQRAAKEWLTDVETEAAIPVSVVRGIDADDSTGSPESSGMALRSGTKKKTADKAET